MDGCQCTLQKFPYTEDAGCAITTGIPVKFGIAHGRSRPEGGSMKRVDVYGSRGVSQISRIFGKSVQNIITTTDFLRPKHNFFSLTVWNLDLYLRNGSEKDVHGLVSSHKLQR